MKFSIIIPSRDRIVDLIKAIKSVENQLFKDFEVIVVNDGSQQKYFEQYQNLKNRFNLAIKIVNLSQTQNGHGPSFSRNEGFRISKGEYVCFLDDDDFWVDRGYLARVNRAIELHNKKVDVYIAHQQAVFSNGEINNHLWLWSYYNSVNNKKVTIDESEYFIGDIKELLKFSGFAHLNTIIVSREIVERIDGFDNSILYEDDRDFFIRMLDKSKGIACSLKIISQHNVPDQMKSNNASTRVKLSNRLLYRLYFLNKAIIFSNRPEIRRSAEKDKIFTIKKLSRILYNQRYYKRSFHYAKEAVLLKFNLKWLVFLFYVFLLKTLSQWGILKKKFHKAKGGL